MEQEGKGTLGRSTNVWHSLSVVILHSYLLYPPWILLMQFEQNHFHLLLAWDDVFRSSTFSSASLSLFFAAVLFFVRTL